MKVCILGNNLTSLTLAKTLINMGLYVDVFSKDNKENHDKLRTIGISTSNLNFFNKNILNIKNLTWNINKIEIFSQNLDDKKILNFEKENQNLFYVFKNYKLIENLKSDLKKNKLFNLKKQISYNVLIKKDYKLIFNCDPKDSITKKFFFKKIDKDYRSYAYTTIIKHKKILNNNIAKQIFTLNGPLAFLPISCTETSIVYSERGNKNTDLEKLIKKYNNKYEIIKFSKPSTISLRSSNLRSYYYKNILAFGDLLHRLHPLAGQGFNMTIRDIKEISKIIKFKLSHGLELNNEVLFEFEKNVKHKNYLFSYGIDFIYEIFKLENKLDNKIISNSIKYFGKKKFINNFFTNYADNGIMI